jgi:hypothetical protein
MEKFLDKSCLNTGQWAFVRMDKPEWTSAFFVKRSQNSKKVYSYIQSRKQWIEYECQFQYQSLHKLSRTQFGSLLKYCAKQPRSRVVPIYLVPTYRYVPIFKSLSSIDTQPPIHQMIYFLCKFSFNLCVLLIWINLLHINCAKYVNL